MECMDCHAYLIEMEGVQREDKAESDLDEERGKAGRMD